MRRITTVLAALAAVALAGPAPAQAQDAGQPAFASVEVIEVVPAEVARFTAAVEMLVQAAREAGLESRFDWDVYQKDGAFHLVSWHASLTDFEDEDLWYRQFEGTPGQATMEAAFAELSGLNARVRTDVHRHLPDLSYMPAEPAVEPAMHRGIFLVRDWVAFGSEESFRENTKAVLALLEEVGYRYPVHVHRTVIGDNGLFVLAVLHDGEANFHGPNALRGLLEKAGKGEAWGKVMQDRMSLLRNHETYNVTYRPELSYHADAGEM